jgi:hypothetical protein
MFKPIVIGAMLILLASARMDAQTVVATYSGTTASLSASASALAAGFESLLNDGTDVAPASISVIYYSGDSKFYLIGTGALSGKTFYVYTELVASGSNLTLKQTAGGKGMKCAHPSCNYDPCSMPPVCAGACNGVGSCALTEIPYPSNGHLGSFY